MDCRKVTKITLRWVFEGCTNARSDENWFKFRKIQTISRYYEPCLSQLSPQFSSVQLGFGKFLIRTDKFPLKR